jgi:two-component system, cell cycle response regulator
VTIPARADQPVSSMQSAPSTPGRFEQNTIMSINGSTARLVPPQPTKRDRAVLVRMDEAHAGQVTTTDGPEIRLGRHPTSTIVLDDEGISRSHARIFQSANRYYVEDLKSSNGTYVNGVRIDRVEVVDGAMIQLGPRVSFRFSVVDEHQERILRQLYESSVRDALTGAFNRQYFMERLSGELAYANRHGTTASLLILDIDHFKKVNDTYGHPAGDAVIKTVALTAQQALRTEDVFARYGGEEFVVLLRGIALEGAARAGERLRRALIASPTTHEGRIIEATVSIGCACLDGSERTAEALIAVADRRLYAAKRGGRNRVVAKD